jgi:hypothetical protein
LAKNIDDSHLNKAYYDYFFEGLLLNLATKYLPILCLAAYVNDTYRPEALLVLWGRDSVFKLSLPGGGGIGITPVLWYVLCLIGFYLAWFGLKRLYVRNRRQSKSESPA